MSGIDNPMLSPDADDEVSESLEIVNPLLMDDEDDNDSLLPDFDEEDFLEALQVPENEEDLLPGSMEDSDYPVNYDDYVQMDVARGYREADDGIKSFDDSFEHVLNSENYDSESGEYEDDVYDGLNNSSVVDEDLNDLHSNDEVYEPDDFSVVEDVDDVVVDDRESLLNMYDAVPGDNDTVYSTSSEDYDSDTFNGNDEEEIVEMSGTSLEELLELHEKSNSDDENDDSYLMSGSMFYHDEDDDDSNNLHQLDLDSIITRAIDMGASDIDLIPNDEVAFTVLGQIVRVPEFGIITSRQISNTYIDITSSVGQEDFLKFPELDTSYEVRRGKYMGRRLRLSIGKTFDSHYMVFRVISDKIPSPDEIGMDPRLLKWSTLPNGLVLINGKTGAGKALAVNTKVPTPDGLRTMADLKVGDLVYDSSMNECSVEWVSEINYNPELYRVIFSDGQSIVADKDHQWIVSSRKSRKLVHGLKDKKRLLKTVSTKDMITEGVIYGKERNKNFAVPVVKSKNSKGDDKKFVVDPYILGVWLGAGKNGNSSIVADKSTLSEFLSNVSDKGYEIDVTYSKDVAGSVFVKLKNLKLDLKKIGVLNDKHVPYDYLMGSYAQRLELLRGLMDFAGSVHKRTGVCEISISGDNYARSISSLVRSLGINAKLDSLDSNNNLNRVVFSTDKKVFKFLHRLDELGFMKQDGDSQKWNYIVSIEPVVSDDSEYSPVLCIGVDSPDHSYLCADYVVTHNSTTLASLIREIQMIRSDKIITIEKPIEYVYGVAGNGSVTQREVGRDTNSFSAALDSAMRQHPDVLLIGEVRNHEEVNAVLYAAETGHLAFSTMHTNSAPHTLNRIKRLFDGEEQVRILGDLSEVARGFSNQLLVRSPDGTKRSAVNEVLEVDETVKNLILSGDVRGIVNYQEETKTTMEHELVKAIMQGRCSVEEARLVTSFRPRLEKILEDEDIV